jgi:hypothetical protein
MVTAKEKERRPDSGRHATPEATELERSILGAILIDSSLFEVVAGSLQPKHFFLDWHQHIYDVMHRLVAAQMPISTLSLLPALEQEGLLNAAGGTDYVLKLEDGVVADRASIEMYVEVVIDRCVRREALHAAESLYARINDVTLALPATLATAAQRFNALHGITESKARTQRLRRLGIRGESLVNDLEQYFSGRAWLPNGGALVLALFAMNTWLFDVFDTTPYLLLESAVPQCGKTTVLRLLEAVSREPIATSSASEAALFRVVQARHPTLLIDEAESLAGRSERAEALLSILNAGYKKGGSALRAEGQSHEPKLFDTFSPKVLASIGGLRGALLDRCIVLTMHRRPPGVSLKSSRARHIKRVATPLRESLEAYALSVREELAILYDSQPEQGYWPGLTDREGELWEPLMHHARLAGGPVDIRALEAARRLSGAKIDMQSGDKNFALALELCEALQSIATEKFAPADLLPILTEKEAWGEVLAGKKEDKARAADVGRFLSRYRLPSRERPHGRTLYRTAEALAWIRAELPVTQDSPAAIAASAASAVDMRSALAADASSTSAECSTPIAGSEVVKIAATKTGVGDASAADAADAADELSFGAVTPTPTAVSVTTPDDERIKLRKLSITSTEPVLKGEL